MYKKKSLFIIYLRFGILNLIIYIFKLKKKKGKKEKMIINSSIDIILNHK